MLEEIVKLIPPVNLLKPGLHDPETIRTIAEFKRLADRWRLDADFRKAYRLNPERTISETGLSIEPEAFRMYVETDEAEKRLQDILEGKLGADALPESYLLYQAAVWELQQNHLRLRETLCVPKNLRFQVWRRRQDKRCRLQVGPVTGNMMQYPLVFELSDGCSMGCPFCALDAKKLKGVFRYTKEHAACWKEILRRMHALIGDAAGYGICYYATEGLDNPDFEKFLADHYLEFGVLPPITTAAWNRDIERTRKFLRFNQENGYYVDRFSVLSPAARDQLFESFSPEELLKVLILPQFPEAPGSNFTKAGRNRNKGDDHTVGSTISCVSGFVVNMQERTVRLVTPYVSDPDHPTGEWILEKCSFTGAEDLDDQMRRMILQYMSEKFDLQRHCSASCDFRLQVKEGRIWAFAQSSGTSLLQAFMEQNTLNLLTSALKERKHTGSGILDLLPDHTDIMLAFLLLNMLWHHGLIDCFA